MNLKYLMISSLISVFLLGSAGCSEPIPQQNQTQSEASQLYEQGGKYFLGKDAPKDYQKAFSYFQMAAEKGLPIAQK